MTVDETLRKTWDEVAYSWNEYESPLRPHEDDLRIMRDALIRWHQSNPVEKARVFLCGVTPEIATMDWPFPIELTAMDQAASMARIVWPGDVPSVRRALVGNWMNSGLPAGSQDIVIGDGGFGFFNYPDGQRALAAELRKLIRPDGLFIYRHYAQAEKRESVSEVIDAMRAGRIGNFHIFKWRLAMAMQESSRTGVKQDDIWQAVMNCGLGSAGLPPTGWTAGAMSTVHFYRGKDSRLYFPTLDEFQSLLAQFFTDLCVEYPRYELGERCPILIGTPK